MIFSTDYLILRQMGIAEVIEYLKAGEVPPSYSMLTEREQKILKEFFGLFGLPRKTLQRIGDELGLSRERVRQIKDRAVSQIVWREQGQYWKGQNLKRK